MNRRVAHRIIHHATHRWGDVRGPRVSEDFADAGSRREHDANAELVGAAFDAEGDGHEERGGQKRDVKRCV